MLPPYFSMKPLRMMSDIEIIMNVIDPNSTKRKQRKDRNNKRNRTSSGLIENSETMKGTETEFEEFVIDRTITPQRKLTVKDIEQSEEKSGNGSKWRQQLESSLLGSFLPKSGAMSEKVQYRKSCFNCDGEHNLRDCPRPKNFRRISKKKSESVDGLRKKQQSYGSLGLSKQKQHDFEPGKLSDNLREALGLQTNEIPEHVYRMRRLGFVKGYPPGWLRKAIKSTDIIKVFSADATNKCEENLMRPPELEMSKIIAYPGFNKDSSELHDRELFKVPPIETFYSEYQNELNNIFQKRRKHEKRKFKSLSKHKKFVDDDDVTIIENDDNKSETRNSETPGEEGTVVLLEGDDGKESVQTPVRNNISMGQSMFELIGTPTFGNKVTPVATLEAFSVGIQPFRAGSEETESRGTFRKLMNKLGEIRAQNLESQAITIVDHDNSTTLVQSDSSLPSKKSKSKKKKTRRKNI